MTKIQMMNQEPLAFLLRQLNQIELACRLSSGACRSRSKNMKEEDHALNCDSCNISCLTECLIVSQVFGKRKNKIKFLDCKMRKKLCKNQTDLQLVETRKRGWRDLVVLRLLMR